MKCPKCDHRAAATDSRFTTDGTDSHAFRRRRRCSNPECNHRFTTYEIMCDRNELEALQSGKAVEASLMRSTDDQLMAELKRRLKRKAAIQYEEHQNDEPLDPFESSGLHNMD